MRIQDIRSTIRGLDGRPQADAPKTGSGAPAESQNSSIHGDLIELSPAAQLAAAAPDQLAASAPEAMSPERLAEIRNRVQTGFYTSPATLADAAGKLREFYGA
jgi:hypothetical protein